MPAGGILSRVAAALASIGVICAAAPASSAPSSSTQVSLQRDGTLAMAGRSLRCGAVRNILDPRLPNLGIAAPGVLVMNPSLLRREPEVVRLFVFHHECGHHHVGASETGADCWAVKAGVRDGWLDKRSLMDICRSFGNAPETSTHPSARWRCGQLARCFAAAVEALPKPAPPAVQLTSSVAPRLIGGPTLIRTGALPADPQRNVRGASQQ